MKKYKFEIVLLSIAFVFACLLEPVITHFYPPTLIQVTTDGTNFADAHAEQLDTQTFLVRCEFGDFFRVSAAKSTIITQFMPTGNGWAIIHFEYLKNNS